MTVNFMQTEPAVRVGPAEATLNSVESLIRKCLSHSCMTRGTFLAAGAPESVKLCVVEGTLAEDREIEHRLLQIQQSTIGWRVTEKPLAPAGEVSTNECSLSGHCSRWPFHN